MFLVAARLRFVLFAFPQLGFECVFDRGASSSALFTPPPPLLFLPVSRNIYCGLCCSLAETQAEGGKEGGRLPKISGNILPPLPIQRHRIYSTNKNADSCFFLPPFFLRFVCSSFLAAPRRFSGAPSLQQDPGISVIVHMPQNDTLCTSPHSAAPWTLEETF